jgi:hypothetical protein
MPGVPERDPNSEIHENHLLSDVTYKIEDAERSTFMINFNVCFLLLVLHIHQKYVEQGAPPKKHGSTKS